MRCGRALQATFSCGPTCRLSAGSCLVRAVERLESAAQRGGSGRGCAGRAGVDVGRCARAEAAELGPGEYIACDLHLCGDGGEGVKLARSVKRVTRDVQDLGRVYDAAGEAIGRVTQLDGGLITWARWSPHRRGRGTYSKRDSK